MAMPLSLLRPAVAMLVGSLLLSGAAAQTAAQRPVVEGILTRSLLERAAFNACAALDGDTPMRELVARSWRLDLADAAEALRKAGFADDVVRPLLARLDLDKATPKFPDRAALVAYCGMLGDWKQRWSLLLFSVPQLEIGRGLAK